MTSRREFLTYTGGTAVAAAIAPPATAETVAAIAKADASQTQGTGRPSYVPVRTLNGWTLPYTMKGGVKEFHLVAEEFEHEFAPW